MKQFLLASALATVTLGASAQYVEDFSNAVELETYGYNAFDAQGIYTLNAFSHEGPFTFNQDGDVLQVISEGYWEWDAVVIKLPAPVEMAVGDQLIIDCQIDGAGIDQSAYAYARTATTLDSTTTAGEMAFDAHAVTEPSNDDRKEVTTTATTLTATATKAQETNYILLYINPGYTTGPSQGWWTETTAPFNGILQINSITVQGNYTMSVGEIPAISASVDQNMPNPFSASSRISYTLEDQANIELKVFDVVGREIATYEQGLQQPGAYNVELDANELGQGVRFYALIANGQTVSTKKMIVE